MTTNLSGIHDWIAERGSILWVRGFFRWKDVVAGEVVGGVAREAFFLLGCDVVRGVVAISVE